MKLENPILMATIGGPSGIRGEVRVRAFTADPMALGDYGSLYNADGEKFKINNLRPAKNGVVIKFKGINTRSDAEGLNRVDLFVDRSALPDVIEEDEFYVSDLIGMEVRSTDGESLGRIRDVPNFGAGDMLEIVADGETLLIEFNRANVPNIDLDNNFLTIIPPLETSERDQD